MPINKSILISASAFALATALSQASSAASPTEIAPVDLNLPAPALSDDGETLGHALDRFSMRLADFGREDDTAPYFSLGALNWRDTASAHIFAGPAMSATPSITLAGQPIVAAATNTTGAGITIGIIDTGVDYTHREFTGRYSAKSTCFSGATCPTAATKKGYDDEGHGTHVAGIAAGTTRGRATKATVLSVKVLDADGSGYDSDIAAGIRYAAANGARVINMSLGGGGANPTLQSALVYAAPRAVIVSAAGNDGNAYGPEYPGAYALTTGIRGSLIIVGAVDSRNRIATFSNTPARKCSVISGATYCMRNYFVVAPGVSIYSSVPGGGYAYESGTSMATPYVSGVVAQVLGQSPYLTPQQAVDIIFRTTTDLGAVGIDDVYGRGLVNPSRALSPVGTTSVALAGASTADYVGTGEALTATLAGPLGGAFRGSSLLKSAVLLDEYGRDYRIDLTRASSTPSLSVGSLVSQQFGAIHPFGFSTGGLSVAGYAIAPDPLTLDFNRDAEGVANPLMRDLTVSAHLAPGLDVAAAFNADMSGRLSAFDLSGDARASLLFIGAGAVESPYLSLTDGGTFAGISYRPFEDLTIRAAFMESDRDARLPGVDRTQFAINPGSSTRLASSSAKTAAVAFNWQPDSWLGLSLNLAHTSEDKGILGGLEAGALAMTDQANTWSAGLSARVELGDGYHLTGAYSIGSTAIDLAPGSIATGFSDVTTASYGIALTRQGVFAEGDMIGFAVTRPIHVIDGSASLRLATGVNDAREITYGDETLILAGAPETNLEVGYLTQASDGDANLALTAAYQVNAGGIEGETAFAGVARFSLRF